MHADSYQLSSVEANDQWRLLRSLIGPFQQYFKEKTSPFDEEESALPSRQCSSHVSSTNGQIQRILLRIVSPSSIFARFSLLRLFPVSKPEEWFEGKRFITREQLIAETEAYFEGLDKSYYSDDLKKLENHWIKYIELKEDLY